MTRISTTFGYIEGQSVPLHGLTRPRISGSPSWITRERMKHGQFEHRLTRPSEASRDDRELYEFRDVDKDPRYQRIDHSQRHAAEARQGFLAEIWQGESLIDLAEAAFMIAAEDDALATNSSVKLPVNHIKSRLQRLANDIDTVVLQGMSEDALPEQVLSEIHRYIFDPSSGFKPPSFGQSNLPLNATVDNPGVYEDARLAYLPDVLFRRKGTPAALAILLSDILRRLMIKGSIDFVARIDCSDFSSVPRAEIIPGLKRSSILTNVSDQRHIQSSETAAPENAEAIASLNLLSSDTLVECLSHLKRSYWPFSWSGRRGGFIGAAKNFLDGADSAEIEAIARAAAHRIRRGIWTSPGGGDLRRAIAASERLVILRGDSQPLERRDLAILYCHAGMFCEARAELRAYKKAASTARSGKSATTRTEMMISRETGLTMKIGDEDWQDAIYADKLLQAIATLSLDQKSQCHDEGPLNLTTAMKRCQKVAPPKTLPLPW